MRRSPADKRREESCERKGAFAEGPSLASIGLRSWEDFYHYKKIGY